ncbi:MAG TPA: tRNA pseudouridine(13) synthase TruD [Candidatus Nanoarchaeia archaeon]|nr:tRNA pseudouridine(13) synthase TruD [Candidatus Nanoarchaeia archaeon]
MYKLKQLPEDFVVIEIHAVKTEPQGKYLYLWMKKKGRNTLDVVQELANKFRIREKDIGFAGSKDKHAVTEQMISIAGMKKEAVEKVKIEGASLEFYGYGKTPISLGDLQGNRFEIVVRNLETEKVERADYIENYFDEQRFSENNVKIGRHLLKKEFGKAAALADEVKVAKYLEQKPTDFVGALKNVPIRLLRMYVNAYQSYIWNKTVATYLEKVGKVLKKVSYSEGELFFVSNPEKFKEMRIPLVGFGHEEAETEEVQEIIDEIMKEENLSSTDFIIKQIPELTLEGELRNVFVDVKDLKIGRKQEDELNAGKSKVKVSFTLPKGSYATMVIKKIVS